MLSPVPKTPTGTMRYQARTSDSEMRSNNNSFVFLYLIGTIKRDTGVVAGGKQVIRLVTTKQKSNPYNLVGRNKNNPDQPPMTMGQRLAMKHFQFDPKAEKHTQEAAAKSGESEGSDWTWETCSSSDEEGVTFVKNSGMTTFSPAKVFIKRAIAYV